MKDISLSVSVKPVRTMGNVLGFATADVGGIVRLRSIRGRRPRVVGTLHGAWLEGPLRQSHPRLEEGLRTLLRKKGYQPNGKWRNPDKRPGYVV